MIFYWFTNSLEQLGLAQANAIRHILTVSRSVPVACLELHIYKGRKVDLMYPLNIFDNTPDLPNLTVNDDDLRLRVAHCTTIGSIFGSLDEIYRNHIRIR